MPNTQTSTLTDAEIESARQLLSKLPRGFLPLPIFLEIARLTPLSIIEMIPLRLNSGRVEVLLTKRPDDDKHWPGMLHTPGTAIRSTDEIGSYRDAFDRILKDELDSVMIKGEPQFLQTFLHESRRGVEDSKIYYIEVIGEPTEGSFYDIYQLPENIIRVYPEVIKVAAAAFMAAHNEYPVAA